MQVLRKVGSALTQSLSFGGCPWLSDVHFPSTNVWLQQVEPWPLLRQVSDFSVEPSRLPLQLSWFLLVKDSI